MLVALHNNLRLEAWAASKGNFYYCPNCKAEVTLKQGRIAISHFAHKPLAVCSWASGETKEHLNAKTLIRDALRQRGYEADYEVELLSVGGDRRADVLARNPSGVRVAFEIQHTPILFDAIEQRTQAYITAGVPVIWVGILSSKMKADADPTSQGIRITQYVIRPWEKWAHAYYFKNLWYIDVENECLWQGTFSDYHIEVPISSWYNEYAEEQSAGGYSRVSKKWKTLDLRGPKPISELSISISTRKAWQARAFSLPGGRIANFKY
jgi:competence protein CoiA